MKSYWSELVIWMAVTVAVVICVVFPSLRKPPAPPQTPQTGQIAITKNGLEIIAD